MKLEAILNAAAAYLNTTAAEFVVNNVNLGLVALNQARTFALLQHDFEFTRELAELTVSSAAGESLENLKLFDTTTPIAAKTIVEIGEVQADNALTPIEWTTVAESIERQRFRVPNNTARVVLSGDRVRVFPWDYLHHRLWFEIYAMPNEWEETDLQSDFEPWTTKGQQFLLWQTVVQLNHLKKEFVFRQEGNLQPPEQLAAQGFEVFKQWDIFKFEQFRRHFRDE